MPAEPFLREHQLAVHGDFEAPAARGPQGPARNVVREFIQQRFRQTDGLWKVVSNDAELDLDHEWARHLASELRVSAWRLPPQRQDTSNTRPGAAGSVR